MAFTTLAAEATIIGNADASADAVVEVLGASVLATDISSVTWGPNKASGQVDILFVGCQHGDEPAGRETLLDHITTWLAALPGFLSTLTIGMIPTVNPDGFAAVARENDNGADLNRDWMSHAEPETQAVADYIAARTPRLIVDMHEQVADGETYDVQFSAGSTDGMRNGHPDLHGVATDLRDTLIADAITAGDDASIYADGSFVSWRNLNVRAYMTHAAGLLIEGRRGPVGSPVAEATRIRVQSDALDAAITWYQSGTVAADLAAARVASQADQATWGAQRRTIRLRSGDYVEPMPTHYELTSAQETTLADWSAWFGITVGADDRIALAQSSRVAIAVLVDPASIDLIVSATPNIDPFVLDYAAGEVSPPLDPTPDDLGLVNDVKAARADGGEYRATLDVGALSTQAPPDGVGVRPAQVDVNVDSELRLPDIAGWALHVGTWDDPHDRFPTIRTNIRSLTTRAAAATLVPAVVALDVAARIVIEGPPLWLPPEDIDQVVLGYSETIGQAEWTQDWQCTPAGPYKISAVENATLGMLLSDTATVSESLTTTETDVSINCGAGPEWVHEADFDILVGGERMTVTAVGAAVGTFPARAQALTVTRSVDGIVKAHAFGAAVSFFHRAHIGL
jgi:hypothetical protein